ncbi:unnamed protein product, partial [Effrenium voratum]
EYVYQRRGIAVRVERDHLQLFQHHLAFSLGGGAFPGRSGCPARHRPDPRPRCHRLGQEAASHARGSGINQPRALGWPSGAGPPALRHAPAGQHRSPG